MVLLLLVVVFSMWIFTAPVRILPGKLNNILSYVDNTFQMNFCRFQSVIS